VTGQSLIKYGKKNIILFHDVNVEKKRYPFVWTVEIRYTNFSVLKNSGTPTIL
jgi:hypothetical protein